MNHLRLALLSLGLLTGTAALADIYRCRWPDGRTEIRSEPCPAGSRGEQHREPAISPEQRAAAEREAERQRALLEARTTERAATETADSPSPAVNHARAMETTPPPALVEECLADLERRALSSGERAELETACRRTGRALPATPEAPSTTVVGNAVSRCIRNVEMMALSPAQRERRILQCQGLSAPVVVRPPSATVPATPAKPPAEPAHALCRPGTDCRRTSR